VLSDKVFLITGSTGRLGCEIVARLENLGATVLPVVLPGHSHRPKRVRWIAKTDPIIINETGDLAKLKSPDYVINFHWLIDRTLPYTGQILYELDHTLNGISFFWDWLNAVSCNRLVNISSTKVFSHLNSNPISADSEPRPISPYGIAKLTVEKFLEAYFYNAGFPLTHLRLCSVASFGEHHTHILSRLFRSSHEDDHIKINTGHTINIIYIDEVIDLIINAALVSDKLRYIIATPPRLVDEIAAKFETISGKKLNADYVDLAAGISDPMYESDIEFFQAAWVRHTSLESMIQRIIDQNLALYTGPSNVMQSV
jgi:nucleoside-diphosphate-sugar epimerase